MNNYFFASSRLCAFAPLRSVKKRLRSYLNAKAQKREDAMFFHNMFLQYICNLSYTRFSHKATKSTKALCALCLCGKQNFILTFSYSGKY